MNFVQIALRAFLAFVKSPTVRELARHAMTGATREILRNIKSNSKRPVKKSVTVMRT